jgi:hypothetical protein
MTYRAVSVVGFGEASFTPGFETTTGAGAGVAVVTGGGAGGVTMIPALQLVSERTRKRSKKLTIDRAPVKQWVPTPGAGAGLGAGAGGAGGAGAGAEMGLRLELMDKVLTSTDWELNGG